MNKKLILIALSVAMFCSASYAQKVIKQGNAVIIDCSNMAPQFYDPKPKPRTTNATNTSAGTNDANQISSDVSGEKVYKKFEVHNNDLSLRINWLTAINTCATLDTDGGGWRLPTVRELMLIWIFKDKLVANGCSAFVNTSYWSASYNHNHNPVRVWYTDFSDGKTIDSGFTPSRELQVRCIRDL